MHIIWKLGRATVSQMIEEITTQPRPPHSTISSIARILNKKGYLDYKAYGRTYEYFPTISKEEYSRGSLKKLVSDYFGGSYQHLVSFLVRDSKLDPEELNDLLDRLDEKDGQ